MNKLRSNHIEKAAIDAVIAAKKSQFGATAIKIEFEIRFNREKASRVGAGCEECEDGVHLCDECDGQGSYDCRESHDQLEDEHGNPVEDENEESCEECDEGRQSCGDCDGEGSWRCRNCGGGTNKWEDMKYIHGRVLRKLAKYGLAVPCQNGEYANARRWKPVSPLVFSKVYHDGTVDTEWTLTLLLDKPENILLLPKLSEAFYSLRKDIKQEVDTSSAGLHMAWLNSDGGFYPTNVSDINSLRFQNFRKSMILLMPALYFLGSCNAKSRSLSYRAPDVSQTQKYSAVAYRGGSLEFRIFDTCYDKPQAMLDNVVVMANCLKFWTQSYTRNYLQNITTEVDFGINQGNELKRLYVTNTHIELLNRGLRMIKPSYYSVTELKKQRNFTVTKNDTKDVEERAKIQAEKDYKKYEAKYGWEMVMQRNSFISRRAQEIALYSSNETPPTPDALKKIEDEAELRVKREILKKQSLGDFCRIQIPKLAKIGEYKLCVV